MAAKIIEPLKEASTCALGNQRWVKNIGILIKNANSKKTKIKLFTINLSFKLRIKKLILEIFSHFRIKTNKGKDPKIVYKNK